MVITNDIHYTKYPTTRVAAIAIMPLHIPVAEERVEEAAVHTSQ
jgi:hypothetical protein